jgi:hypothetical protein
MDNGATAEGVSRSNFSRFVAKPLYNAGHELFGWLMGILFPVPDGGFVDSKYLRQVSLKQVQFKSAAFQMLPNSLRLYRDSLCALPAVRKGA